MAIPDQTVYVIGRPEGHQTVRTTSIQFWLDRPDTPPGYAQTRAVINWKAQRTIAARYAAAKAAEAEGDQPGGGDDAERVRAFLETLDDMDASGLRLIAWEALQMAEDPDRADVGVDGGRVSTICLGESIAISKKPGGVVHAATRP